MTKIYFDGFSSPHKHEAAGYAVVVEDDQIGTLFSKIVYVNPTQTNNECELLGLKAALEWARTAQIPRRITYLTCYRKWVSEVIYSPFRGIVYGDSKLAVDLYNRRVRTKVTRLSNIVESLSVYSPRKRYNVHWISRQHNVAGKLIASFRGKSAK